MSPRQSRSSRHRSIVVPALVAAAVGLALTACSTSTRTAGATDPTTPSTSATATTTTIDATTAATATATPSKKAPTKAPAATPRSSAAKATPLPASTAPAALPPRTTPAARTTAARPTVPATPTKPRATVPAAGRQLPLPYNGSAQQVVTVVAPYSSSTTATVTAWARTSNGWTIAAGPYAAYIGSNGVGATREGMSRTPAGVFGLTQAFGNQANNGTRLPYFQAGPRDWWDENPASPTYNTHVVRSSSPGGESENLYTAGWVYSHAVNIDYNTARVPGAGSAFFLHVTNGSPTAGCVAIGASQLTTVMRWLNPAAHPVIDIGVG